MSCNGADRDSRFVITRGVDNSFVFTIKANNSTLPIEIDPSDTFHGILRDLDTDTVILEQDLVVDSALNGRIRLDIEAADTTDMTSMKGGREDRWYLLPVYSLTLVCKTVVNGEFIARISMVYVN
jgi:hypothetical protein